MARGTVFTYFFHQERKNVMNKKKSILIIILGSILCLVLASIEIVLISIFILIFGTLIVYKLDRILEELKNKKENEHNS